MTNAHLITTFYRAFADGDAEGMIDCYHADVVFEDPAFGRLEGERARAMWRMLLSSDGNPRIHFSDVEANDTTGSAEWMAHYQFGAKKRNVVNMVVANFRFQDGLIIEHTDTFDLWAWSRQALGLNGLLLGWSGFMRNQIQATTKERMDRFMAG